MLRFFSKIQIKKIICFVCLLRAVLLKIYPDREREGLIRQRSGMQDHVGHAGFSRAMNLIGQRYRDVTRNLRSTMYEAAKTLMSMQLML